LVSKWSIPSQEAWKLGIPFILIMEFDTKPRTVTSQEKRRTS
jgi:hypothetical protein